jgi:hypothetical protein
MSPLRPAKIVATLFQLLGGDLSSPAQPDGPGCSCERCEQAWNRRKALVAASARTGVGVGVRRVGPA